MRNPSFNLLRCKDIKKGIPAMVYRVKTNFVSEDNSLLKL